jgi:murein L,D-transpeptidase YcbB/YkuD
MRFLVILLILLGSILLLSGHGYALNLNDPVDNYSLSGCWLPFDKTELNGPINLANISMFHSSPSLIKFNHSYGLIHNFNHNRITIPTQNIETGNAGNVTDKVRECLISQLTSLKIKNEIDAKIHLIYNPELILDFYVHREFKPVWVTKEGLNNKAEFFINTIIQADHEGLNSKTYHQKDILTLLTHIKLGIAKDTDESEKLAELDLLLSDAFFSFGSHLSEGIVDPYSNNFNWYIKKPRKNLAKIFQTMLYDDDLKGFVDALQPHHSGYLRLKTALLKYMNINKSGCWHEVPAGGTMRKGDHGTGISALRSRLIVSGDLTDSNNNNQTYFDDVLEEGIRRFQTRHGLEVDGVVGSKTLAALNVPAEDRIRQIRLNMERWRWLPQDLGERHIMVNTADFKLNVVENEKTTESIRAIVGKRERPTPVLSRKIRHLELNPYWNIPHNIALNDIIPSIKKDPGYLADNNIRIFENWEEDARELNPESIDWNKITRRNFICRFRQDPANSNAMGRVKFIFPNKYSIYLHDTPARNLFNMAKRTFSSGCIRIEKPMKLAVYLLKDNPKWNLEKLIVTVNSKKNKAILLSHPINIHILYWTAWVDKDGIINFRDDIYGRDSQLNIAFNKKATSPGVLYGSKSKKRYFSSRILPVSDPHNINMNKIRAGMAGNSTGL